MFNPEKSVELNKRDSELNVEKIIDSGGSTHTSLDYFEKLEKYSKSEIEKDKNTLKSAERFFQEKESKLPKEKKESLEKSQKRGEAMEIILADLLDRWLETEDIEVITQRTTKFDDVVNGVDIIVEFKTPNSIEKTALAVDASLNVSGIQNKLEKCFRKVKGEEEKFQVKYFQGQFEDESGEYPHGPLKTVVPMAVGLDYKNANKLFDDFANYLSARENGFDEGQKKMKKIESDSIRKVFLMQIKNQLDFYIKNKNELQPGMVDEIKKISTIIEEISENMESVVCDLKQKDDWVLKETEKFSK